MNTSEESGRHSLDFPSHQYCLSPNDKRKKSKIKRDNTKLKRKLNQSQNDIIDSHDEIEQRRFLSLDHSNINEDIQETTNLVDKVLFSEHMHLTKSNNKEILKSNWIVTKIPLKKDEATLKLKYMIRKGIPTMYISLVWTVVTGGYEAMESSPKQYFHNLNEVFGNNISCSILNYPTFGGNLSVKEHFLKGHATNVAKRLLCVYGMCYPRLQFLPPLPDIICLLLHYLKEEETYFSVNEILKEVSNSRKHLVFNKVGWSTIILIFDELVKLYFPKVWSLMKKLNMTTTRPFSERWFFRVFIEDLPMRLVITIFGSYLCEGLNVLFKAGLAIIKMCKFALFECTSEEAFIQTIRDSSLQTNDINQFLKNAYSFKVSKVVKKLFSSNQTVNFYQSISVNNGSPFYYRPEISDPSSIVSYDEWEVIYGWIPPNVRRKKPTLLYTSERNGKSLISIYNRVENIYPTILFVKSANQRTFGAFISSSWKRKKNISQSSKECFLFTLSPEIAKFEWIKGTDTHFVVKSDSKVAFGVGSYGYALMITGDGYGSSSKTDCFENELLNGEDSEYFECKVIEIYGFS